MEPQAVARLVEPGYIPGAGIPGAGRIYLDTDQVGVFRLDMDVGGLYGQAANKRQQITHQSLGFNCISFSLKNRPWRLGSNSQLSISCGDHTGSKTQAVQEIPFSSK